MLASAYGDHILTAVAALTVLAAFVTLMVIPRRSANHFATAFGVLLISPLVAFLALTTLSGWVEYIHSAAAGLPFVANIRPIQSGGFVSALDTLCVALLFYAAYVVVVISHRLFDTIRILKVSRRRLVLSLQQTGGGNAPPVS